jgi:Fe-S cluster assembly iron-binding protein IscA
VDISESASEVLARAYDAAARFNTDAKVRVFRRKGVIETAFADAPNEGDEVLHHEGFTLYVAADVGDGTLDTTDEHDQLILRGG